MAATDVLKSLSEQGLRDRLAELERERKATMVLLRAKRALYHSGNSKRRGGAR